MFRRTLSVLLVALAVMSASVLASRPAFAAATIRITKIHYGQIGTNLNTEYIVFKNVSTTTRSMTGWTITSSPATDNQSYRFGTLRLAPGASVTLYTGRGTNTATKRYWGDVSTAAHGGAIWNNDGDYAVLQNSVGTIITTCRYAGGGTTAYC